jgi:hypothetical protein
VERKGGEGSKGSKRSVRVARMTSALVCSCMSGCRQAGLFVAGVADCAPEGQGRERAKAATREKDAGVCTVNALCVAPRVDWNTAFRGVQRALLRAQACAFRLVCGGASRGFRAEVFRRLTRSRAPTR